MYYYPDITFTGAFPPDLPDGEYIIAPLFTDNSSWRIMETPSYLPVIVKGDSVYINIEPGEEEEEEEEEPKELDFSKDIDYIEVGYDSNNDWWLLLMTNYEKEIPWVQIYFKKTPTSIAGSYEFKDSSILKKGTSVGYMWLTDSQSPDVAFTAGTIDIARHLPDSQDGYPIYEFVIAATGRDNKQYNCHVQQEVIMYDANSKTPITPTDSEVVTDIHLNKAQTNVTKVLKNGQLMIRHSGRIYNMQGQIISVK